MIEPICDYSGPRQRILLADDDPLHLELVQNLLRPLGFRVYPARDGKSCIQLAAQCRPELALIDSRCRNVGMGSRPTLRACGLEPMKIMIVSANAHEYGHAGAPHMRSSPSRSNCSRCCSASDTVGALVDPRGGRRGGR